MLQPGPTPSQLPDHSLRCENCGAALLSSASARTVRCPYCASTSVVERPPTPDRPAPTFVLGFSLGREAAKAKVAAWLKSRGPFTVSAVRRASLEHVQGVYLPAYLYSAVAKSAWSAEIGEEYQTTERYTTTENGRRVTKTRTVTKTEWRRLSGQHETYVMDVLVTASKGLPNAELEQVEPFDLRLLRRYDPALLSGWLAEEPTLTQAQCRALAHQEAQAELDRALHAFMPGDKHSNLVRRTELDREALELCLLPVWLLAARYHPKKPPVRIVVNGQSGEVVGKAPLSWVKVALASVAAGLALVAGMLLLLGALR